jgi:hypothetical protein
MSKVTASTVVSDWQDSLSIAADCLTSFSCFKSFLVKTDLSAFLLLSFPLDELALLESGAVPDSACVLGPLST